MGQFVSSRERVIAIALIILLFLVNLSIAKRSPYGAWLDEVGYADPGLNLATGKGWTSMGEPVFWVDNSPLYPAGLSVWAHFFGVSRVSARAYCYFLAALALFFLWLGAFRFNLLTSTYRLFWIAFLSTEYAMNWMERNGRYDVLIFLGLAIAWYGASLSGLLARRSVIFAGCCCAVLAGVICVPYIFGLAGLITLFTHFRWWKEAMVALGGTVCSLLAVVGFYAFYGHLDEFHRRVTQLSSVSDTHVIAKVFQIFLYPKDDAGLILTLIALVILSCFVGLVSSSDFRRWLIFGWLIVILMPCLMIGRGIFPMMYFYMLIVPLSLAVLQAAAFAWQNPRGRCAAIPVMLLLGMACFTGLPPRLYFSWREWDLRDPQHIRDFVHLYVQPGDDVVADPFFYYELRDYVKSLDAPPYVRKLPAADAGQINLIIVDDEAYPNLTLDTSSLPGVGGGWKKIAVFPTPDMTHGKTPPRSTHTFTLYRRETTPPQPKSL